MWMRYVMSSSMLEREYCVEIKSEISFAISLTMVSLSNMRDVWALTSVKPRPEWHGCIIDTTLLGNDSAMYPSYSKVPSLQGRGWLFASGLREMIETCIPENLSQREIVHRDTLHLSYCFRDNRWVPILSTKWTIHSRLFWAIGVRTRGVAHLSKVVHHPCDGRDGGLLLCVVCVNWLRIIHRV